MPESPDDPPAPKPAFLSPSAGARSGASAHVTAAAQLTASATATSGATAVLTVHRALLKSARALLDDGHAPAAVVSAQTASEVFIEQTLATLLDLHYMGHVWDAIGDFIPSYNIGSERVRRLYARLTDDYIEKQPFWPAYTAHVKLRHKIVHEGADATRAQAEDSYAAVDALMNHVDGIVLRTRRLRGR